MKKQNLAKEFIPEIINILEAFEEGLLELEKTGDEASPDLINRVFRAIHSIKGSASFCDFESLKQVSHAMENVLMQVRDGSMKLNSGIIDVLLSGVDCIHMMVKESGSYVETSCDDEISNLDDLLKTFVNKSAPPPGAKPSGAARKRGGRHGGAPSADHADGMMLKVDGGDGDGPHYFNIGKDSLDAGLSDNMYLFAIRVFHDEDLEKKGRTIRDFVAEIEASGKCLASDIGGKKPRDEESREERPDIHHFLVGTIFPFELLREVLQISGEQILLIEKPVFESKTAPETTSPASEPDVAPGAVAPAPGKTPPEQIAPPPAPTTIRLGVDLVDNLMNLAGELVLGRNQLRQAIEEFITANPRIAPVMKHVDRITSETQEDIMRMRMQPVGNILNKLPRIARDMSRVLTKKVNLTIEGGNVELDKSILEGLSNPMTHLIRNCVDHGIELPGERINSGKPETGAIHVKVFHEGGRVNIIINDDGRGIDAGQIVEKAVGKKLVDRTHANRMKEKEKLNLIFLPG
ncbi:MAG: hypothetical protein GY859_16980, partial [Desulfobacterales bacterium]|nr:hypothetical protein [Desulfobacterales bacterium]